jgi:multisubunit Na+/H+ antiporter MnhB subunit
MKSPSPQFVVYAVGVLLFGLAYEPVKQALGGEWMFVAAAIVYLLMLRAVGALVARAWTSARKSNE